MLELMVTNAKEQPGNNSIKCAGTRANLVLYVKYSYILGQKPHYTAVPFEVISLLSKIICLELFLFLYN